MQHGKRGDGAAKERAAIPAGIRHHVPRSEEALHTFHDEVKGRVGGHGARVTSRAVRELGELIERDSVVRMYVEETLRQVQSLPGAPPSTVKTVEELLAALNYITTLAPLFNADPAKRHAFPMSSLFVYMMMTVAGESLFRVGSFNEQLRRILKEWCVFLDSPASTTVLNETATGWLSAAAVKEFELDQFEVDRSKPHWGFNSYNAFFHRQIKPDRRPVASPNDPKVIVSANDGNLVSIARGVKLYDEFWLKGEPFSLIDMLNRSEHTARFVGGDVVQTFLSGSNYHRWHAPIAGTVRDARVVDGLQFSDAESAGPDPNGDLSEGYYASVNTRGLVFIESDEPKLGMVCVIPIGITEISSVSITVSRGQRLEKGQELGYFSYGGSSMCLVFQPDAVKEFDMGTPPPKPVVDPSSGPPVKVNALIAKARG
jgi:phosphatidylserine decarboxylase